MKPVKGWDKAEPLPSRLSGKFSEFFKRKPVRRKLEESIYRLNSIREKLGEFAEKLERRDREYLEKCMDAYSAGDEARARIYANECSEIRKMVRLVVGSQLAIEQAALRLETIREFGDLASVMPSVAKLVKSLKGKLENVFPEVSYELGRVDKSLGSLLDEFGEIPGETGLSFKPTSQEAEEILKAASVLAEQRIKEKLPGLPLEADEASTHHS